MGCQAVEVRAVDLRKPAKGVIRKKAVEREAPGDGVRSEGRDDFGEQPLLRAPAGQDLVHP